ncbi:hypothetical protein NC653_002151 [Populus alba x Populus x berolinensis]|uniref:Uncharacterized protein n=1 Tax=Populus alba x Populus x berolinensis TaxID=444605 RepID=A0AAD6RMY6_9ROSI|nr:hypothetical protein NC653_002151 [Populus alba x Populus x berolinensis]
MKISFLRETTQRLMLDPSTMMKQSLGVKGGDVAFPCGYQNKTDQSDAINLVNSGCRILVQGRSYQRNPLRN